MRRLWLAIAAVIAVGHMAAAQPANNGGGQSHTTRVLVKPKHGRPSPSQAIQGSSVARTFATFGNLEVLNLPSGVPVQVALAILKQSKDVEYAEPDYIVKLQGTDPNDFRYYTGELWGLHNTGYLGGTPGADIKAPEAWDIRHDAPNIIVALVDSGVRMTHEDIRGNLWTNPREIPGNGIDDDGNGVIDDVHGLNAWLDNGNPEDDLGHGTHVAGSIGAAGNNSVGVVGVAWKVQLMPTKFTDPQGNGTVSDAIACIDYARQMGAHIINASWGATDLFNSTALRDAIAAARDAGIIFVTVAGNNSGDNDAVPYYPGAFALDNIVVVTATDRNDQLAFFANYGAKSVHLGAPGHNIFSAWIGSDSDYQYYNGGSMSVAHVSGAAALVKAQFPGDNYRATIKRILDNVDPLPSLAGKTSTGGRLNLFKSLGGLVARPVISVAAADATAAEAAGDTATFTISRTGATTAPLTVLYSMGGTATNGVDYQALAGTAIIPIGQSSVSVTVQPVDDTQFEGSETVTLTVAPAAVYTVGLPATASVTIADNDAAPLPVVTLAASDASAAEAARESGAFTLTRTGPTTAALTVALTLSGTARNGIDYDTIPAAVTIPVGASAGTILVRPIDDAEVEGSETVILAISSASNYVTGAASSATVTIADNDVAPPPPANLPSVSIAATRPWTIELGLLEGQFQITRTGATTQPLTVRLAVSGTAGNGIDFTRIADTVVIPAGKTAVTIKVDPIRDRIIEPTETIVLTAVPQPAYKVAGTGNATVYLFDDDALFAFLAKLRNGDGQ